MKQPPLPAIRWTDVSEFPGVLNLIPRQAHKAYIISSVICISRVASSDSKVLEPGQLTRRMKKKKKKYTTSQKEKQHKNRYKLKAYVWHTRTRESNSMHLVRKMLRMEQVERRRTIIPGKCFHTLTTWAKLVDANGFLVE